MRIAICDDSQKDLLDLKNQINAYGQDHPSLGLTCDTFSDAYELMDRMESKEYSIIFLDIIMPGLNGIDAAKEIRKINEAVEIVFLTSSPEYAVESYAVRANYYLMKPASKESIYSVLDRMMERMEAKEDVIVLKNAQSISAVPYNTICYTEVFAKTITFYLTDGTSRQVRGTLSEYAPILLKHMGFFQVHRSYIVNFRNMRELSASGFAVKGSEKIVPIARNLYKDTKEAYINYLFDGER